MLRWLTAGESHGPALVGVLEGLPAGVAVTTDDVRAALARRRLGHGRGARMTFERDRAEILSGVRHGLTLGSPVALTIENKDWKNWADVMAVEPPAPVRPTPPAARGRPPSPSPTWATRCSRPRSRPARPG